MKRQTLLLLLASASLFWAGTTLAAPDITRETLGKLDGWAATQTGTSGGAAAKAEHVFSISNRKQLVDALNMAGSQPKIIQIQGTINLSADDEGRELTEKDYTVAPYNFDAYMAAYAPALWNIKLDANKLPNHKLSGPQEIARIQSAKKQKQQVVIKLTSNTTLLGLGTDAKIIHGTLLIGEGVENVIIRNITFEDAFDYFPQWDPSDSFKIDRRYSGCQDIYVDSKTGPQQCPGGRWNSQYDNISIYGGKFVWIDHCTFSDGARPDRLFPPVFPFPHNEAAQKVQHHDGLLDITNGADFVTVSFNHFKDHDKTSLIGSSDSRTSDTGKLNVTFHSNWFENLSQRMPRVRFGKVHIYNNYFSDTVLGRSVFQHALGVGTHSAIYSENNYFEIQNGNVHAAVVNMGGSVFFDSGSMLNGQAADLLAGANAANPKRLLSAEIGWTPTLYLKPPIPAAEVPAFVKANTGAGKR